MSLAQSSFDNNGKRTRTRSSGPLRGLSRLEAAEYIGVGTTLFDELVKTGKMPKPIQIKSRTVWDIRRLDDAFDVLGDYDSNPWDEISLKGGKSW